MSALFFGSISTVSDTSELQRRSFNEAFALHGLDWNWDQVTYRSMLAEAGGEKRIARFAESRGETVDAAAVHGTKSEVFQNYLAEGVAEPRPGVVEALGAARNAGRKVGFVTSTSSANVDALLSSLSPDLSVRDFDVIVTGDDTVERKPAPEPYLVALRTLGIEAGSAIAIEDNVDGVTSVKAAGIRCVALPNANTLDDDFSAADQVVGTLEAADL